LPAKETYNWKTLLLDSIFGFGKNFVVNSNRFESNNERFGEDSFIIHINCF